MARQVRNSGQNRRARDEGYSATADEYRAPRGQRQIWSKSKARSYQRSHPGNQAKSPWCYTRGHLQRNGKAGRTTSRIESGQEVAHGTAQWRAPTGGINLRGTENKQRERTK